MLLAVSIVGAAPGATKLTRYTSLTSLWHQKFEGLLTKQVRLKYKSILQSLLQNQSRSSFEEITFARINNRNIKSCKTIHECIGYLLLHIDHNVSFL